MDTECDVCGTPFDDTEITTATTTYVKSGVDLKQTTKLFCDFCLYQEPDFVKVYGDGESVEPDPEDDIEEDITGEDFGTTTETEPDTIEEEPEEGWLPEEPPEQ